ncbi:MAG: cell wall-binding repeat-containing protein [Gracilibacteraceae bacterium]|nr:cell wall-binding repeat-containing protein [Gracilibacteraceae bacterium]
MSEDHRCTEHIYIADGLTLVDALTGSVLAAKSGAAVMLVAPGTPRTVPAGSANPLMKVYAFGTETEP